MPKRGLTHTDGMNVVVLEERSDHGITNHNIGNFKGLQFQ